MKKRMGMWVAILAATAAGYAAWSWSAAYAEEAKANADKAAADAEFAKKNYARAVELYKKALEAITRSHADGPAVEERIRDCWLGMRRWDDALTEAKATIEARPGTYHAARASAFIGRVSANMPHYYYKKDNVISRGEWVQDGEYHWTEYDDYRTSAAAFEAALTVYEALQASADADLAKTGINRGDLVADAVSVYVDHAALLENYRWYVPDSDELPLVWQVDPRREAAFQALWSNDTKTRWLYHSAVKRAGAAKLGDVEAVARYKRAAFHARRHGAVWGSQWTDANFRQFPEGEDPFFDLRWILESQSEHAIADEAAFLLARSLEASGRYTDAIVAYRDVAKRYPKSNWVSDSQAAIQEIERAVLNFNYQRSASFRPGEAIVLSVWSRNLPDILFTARELDLTALVSDNRAQSDPNFSLGGIAGYLAANKSLWDAVVGREVTRWTLDTADTGEHRYHRHEVTAPEAVTKEGAYYIEATGLGLSYGVVVIVSNLGVIEKVDGLQTVAWVVDLETGQPVPNVIVGIRELYHLNNARTSSVDTMVNVADQDGLASKPHKLTGRRNNQGWSYGVEVFAAIENRYAMTQRLNQPWWNYDEGVVFRTLIETDRPVYRPEQEVFFKATLRRKDGGEWKNTPGIAAQVLIQDPKGNKLFDQQLTASANGTVSGSIKLEKEPPLGEYYMQVWPSQFNDWRTRASYNFAVEEYKKPEYEVSVKFAKPQVKAGEKAEAKINAWYYFGAPVVGAEVKYTVQRKFYYNQYSFARDYDWLYGRRYIRSWYRSYDYWTTELVSQGTGVTDAEGNLTVEIDSSVAAGKWPDQDHTYMISAEVTDASRRVINGAGNLNVTRQAYYAYLDNKRGYARPGDTVQVELRTVNASGGPVTVAGAMTISRVFNEPDPANVGATIRRTVLREESPIATDASGRTYFEWQSDQAGLWEFRYTGKDEWGGEVTNFVDVWVADPDGRDVDFHFTSLELLTEKETYEKGETLNLLVHAVAPDTAVLLTEEANAEILKTRVVRMKGKSAIVGVPLTAKHVPNFFFKGLAVFRGQMWTADREVFVPPVDKFLTVNVTPNQKEYLPGETASFDVETLDRNGKAVSAEVSFGVVDESVYYIVPSRVADPKKLYYGDRRSRSISENNSRQWSSGATAEDKNQYAEFKRHGTPLGWSNAFMMGDGESRDRFSRDEFARNKEGAPATAAPAESAAADPMDGALRQLDAGEELKDMASGSSGGGGAVGGRMERRARGGGGGKGDDKFAEEAQAMGLEQGGVDPLVEPKMRSEFKDTAFWAPSVTTDASGKATVRVTMPDNLTRWDVVARGATTGSAFGSAQQKVVTSKNLMIRLQAPRFFVERDELVLSGIVNNYLPTSVVALVELDLQGDAISASSETVREIEVPKGGSVRVDWLVKVVKAGDVTVAMSAKTTRESDAMKMEFPVFVHGMETFTAVNGTITGDGAQTVSIPVPQKRRVNETSLKVTLSPSTAATLLEALPYLIEYPYGCVEQTMSRFLPAVTVARTLEAAGVNLEELQTARKTDDFQHLKSRPWSYYRPAPVYSTAGLAYVVKAGVSRLESFQHGDGGWGWWQYDKSDPWMSAYVVYGLTQAKAAGYAISGNVIERGQAFLKGELSHIDRIHLANWMGFALAESGAPDKAILAKLYERRDDLTLYSKALLAIACHTAGMAEQAKIMIENFENWVSRDEANNQAWWKPWSNEYWYWYNDKIETNAWILQAFLRIDPANKLVEPSVNWLVGNRKGTRWYSTRDTAFAVYALVEYMKSRDEFNPDVRLAVSIDGREVKSVHVTRENMFTFDNTVALFGDAIEGGDRQITISRKGKGKLFFSAYLTAFSLEDEIPASGNGIAINRTYRKKTESVEKVTIAGVDTERRAWTYADLKSGDTVTSGDRIEVGLAITSDNEYEYLVFEDFKPAGCETVALRSGYTWGQVVSNMELRDEKVVCFVGYLSKGTHSITYDLRAEIPGNFGALPTKGYAMYASDIRATAASFRLKIEDKKTEVPK